MVVYLDNRTEFANVFCGKTRVLVVKLGASQVPESFHCDFLTGGLLIFSRTRHRSSRYSAPHSCFVFERSRVQNSVQKLVILPYLVCSLGHFKVNSEEVPQIKFTVAFILCHWKHCRVDWITKNVSMNRNNCRTANQTHYKHYVTQSGNL
jgi:hypothetical protein